MIMTKTIKLPRTVDRYPHVDTVFLKQVDMRLGDERPIGLDSVLPVFFVAESPNFFQMFNGGK